MKLLIGLGNIGDKYVTTRHNAGFIFIDELAKKIEKQTGTTINWKQNPALKAHVAKTKYNNEEIILAKPTTLMNLSGEAASAIKNYYKLATEDVIAIYDDVDIPLGTIRIREKGSAGTHNGMKSMIQHLGTDEFIRIRIGIESRGEIAPKEQDTASFVLSNFLQEEIGELEGAIIKAIGEVEELLK